MSADAQKVRGSLFLAAMFHQASQRQPKKFGCLFYARASLWRRPGGNWRSQSEACHGGLSRRSHTKPEELLAGIIANEILDWKFPDGTWLDGIGGIGIGYAQIALKTARKHGTTGSDSEIKKRLNSYDESVEIAARILKSYFDEFCDSVQNNKLGPGFQNSTLYYMAKPYILQRDDFVNMKL